MTPELGWWLAGFTDGEGCFAITKRTPKNGRQSYGCTFVVKVRADDHRVIRTLPRLTGLGSVREQRASLDAHRANKPAIRWEVNTQADTLALVALFEKYPLRSKKARDFDVWARAVRYWNAPLRIRIGLIGRGGARYCVNQQPLEQFHAELAELRRFAA